uniref:Radical SAM core domain-containing protein n=1 Tax=Hanusia phi TaxID=3032 RepID=A0A7S0DYL3_9CRYP|mmetsp:Transcript_13090/g.30112  ORF Transcript_13090/g.30112 Transcript_13090/m.30112 type:complete len:414 (+) Transcript_13090:3-1244(+)
MLLLRVRGMNKVLAIPALRSVFRVPTANFSARVQQQKKRIAKEILKDQAKWNLLLTKPEDLAKLLQGPGRAHAVWKALRHGSENFEDISGVAYDALCQKCFLPDVEVKKVTKSECGTRKLLIEMEDGQAVETVVIPSEVNTKSGRSRTTICVSSQVGCARGCVFCATGKLGLRGQLEADEILMQVFHGLRVIREENLPPTVTVVFMGMGEPLNNFREVRRAIDMLTDHGAFDLHGNFVTVSTVGPNPEAIRKLLGCPTRIAWSLHAADDQVRKRLVPTHVHSTAALRDAFTEVTLTRNKRMMPLIEVTLVDGINDQEKHARDIVELFRPWKELGIKIKINLLPCNSIGDPDLRPSPEDVVVKFRNLLVQEGCVATIRKARGDQEGSACGQLSAGLMRNQARKEGVGEENENGP